MKTSGLSATGENMKTFYDYDEITDSAHEERDSTIKIIIDYIFMFGLVFGAIPMIIMFMK